MLNILEHYVEYECSPAWECGLVRRHTAGSPQHTGMHARHARLHSTGILHPGIERLLAGHEPAVR